MFIFSASEYVCLVRYFCVVWHVYLLCEAGNSYALTAAKKSKVLPFVLLHILYIYVCLFGGACLFSILCLAM